MIRFAKYFVTGAVAASVDFVIFFLLVKMAGWPWYIAGTVSFVGATLVNYLLSVRHVFTSGIRFGKKHEVLLIFLVSAVGLAVNQAALFLLIRAHIPILLAKIGATGSVFLWNYAARRWYVFREA